MSQQRAKCRLDMVVGLTRGIGAGGALAPSTSHEPWSLRLLAACCAYAPAHAALHRDLQWLGTGGGMRGFPVTTLATCMAAPPTLGARCSARGDVRCDYIWGSEALSRQRRAAIEAFGFHWRLTSRSLRARFALVFAARTPFPSRLCLAQDLSLILPPLPFSK